MNPHATWLSLATLENLKVVVFNLIIFVTLVPNAWILQDMMVLLGIYATTVPMGAVFAAFYVGCSYLARILASDTPVTSIGKFLASERLLYVTLLYIISMVVLFHTVLRPIQLPLDERTIRSFVRLLAGPLVCLFFLGRWHRARPWPFLLILTVTWILLVLEAWGSDASIEMSNLLRKTMLGSGNSAAHTVAARGFFGIYSEPSHAFASLMLCLGGLLVCWRRSLVRLRTLCFGTLVFAAVLMAGVSRTGVLSTSIAVALFVLLSAWQLLSSNKFRQLPSRLRRYIPGILIGTAVGSVVMAFVLAVPLLLASPYHSYVAVDAAGSGSGSAAGSRVGLLLRTLDTLPNLISGGDISRNLGTLDILVAGRLTQTWIGYSQPALEPYGMQIGSASSYLRGLDQARSWQEEHQREELDFEHGRILSNALSLRYARERGHNDGLLMERDRHALSQRAERTVYSLRSYGALLSFYHGIFGWLAILLLVASVLHPAHLRVARAEPPLMAAAAVGILTIMTFSIPTLPSAWPLIAIPAYFAKVHDAGEQEAREVMHGRDRPFLHRPMPAPAANLRPTT